MSALMIDSKNELKEIRKNDWPPQPAVIRFLAKLISWTFHPVFVPVYIVFFMVYVHPYLFIGFDPWNKTRVMLMAVLMFTFFPLVTVLLLKGLNFINSIFLKTQKDRIIPLVACGVWYFWITYIWWNSNKIEGSFAVPKEGISLALSVFLASWLALMANIKIKISLHAISMGVMMAFFLVLAFTQAINIGIYLSMALLIAGLVCTSRFIVSDHSPMEVYGGLALGVFAHLASVVVV